MLDKLTADTTPDPVSDTGVLVDEPALLTESVPVIDPTVVGVKVMLSAQVAASWAQVPGSTV